MGRSTRHPPTRYGRVALPLPAARPSRTSELRARERPPRPGRARVRAVRHRRPRRGPVLRRRGQHAKAAPDDVLASGSPRPTTARPGAAAPAAAAVVPQHLVVGPRRPASGLPLDDAARSSTRGTSRRGRRPSTASSAGTSCSPRAHRGSWCATTRPTRSGCSARRATRRPTRRTPSDAGRRPRRRLGAVDPTGPAPRRRSGTAFDAVAAGGDRHGASCGCVAEPRSGERPFAAVASRRVLRRPRGGGRRVLRHGRPGRHARRGRPASSRGARSPACSGASSFTGIDVEQWLEGDPGQPAPPAARRASGRGATSAWRHLSLADVISMPDEWEYPWFASWDLAFHCVTLAHIDPAFAKDQLVLLCREWAMHPDGQLPAYEWAFGDVNPPVHAWAAWQVYCLDGARDHDFLCGCSASCCSTSRWWVNRKDADGSEPVRGRLPRAWTTSGLFDRSAPLPRRVAARAVRRHRLDGVLSACRCCGSRSSWPATDTAWDDLATKFLEHFLAIAQAHGRLRQPGDVAVGRAGRVLLRRPGRGRTAATSRCGCARWSGCCRCSRSPWRRTGSPTSCPTSPAGCGWLRRHRPELTDAAWSARTDGRPPDPVAARRPSGCRGCCAGCSTRRSSSRRTASGRCRRPTATAVQHRGRRAAD